MSVAALLRGLSPESAYRRFQTALGSGPTAAMLDALLPEGPHGGAVLAHAGSALVGHGVWHRAGATSVAEIGVVVADDRQRAGDRHRPGRDVLLADLAARGDRAGSRSSPPRPTRPSSRMVAATAPDALREYDGATVSYRFGVRASLARTVA